MYMCIYEKDKEIYENGIDKETEEFKNRLEIGLKMK